jgi:hypothetical protein
MSRMQSACARRCFFFPSATRCTSLSRCTSAWTTSRWTKGVSWRHRPPTGLYAAPIQATTACQQAGMDTRRRCVFLSCLQGLHLAASELKALRPGTRPSVLAHLPWLAFVRSPCPGPSSAGMQSAASAPLATPLFSDAPTPQPPTASGPALSLRSCSTR